MSMVPHDDRQTDPPSGNRFLQLPVIGRLFRFLTWCLIFMGIYASSSVCPFCGKVGCPVGGVSAGIVGGFFALVIEKGKSILSRLANMCSRVRTKFRSKP
jgi:hypothetical protein